MTEPNVIPNKYLNRRLQKCGKCGSTAVRVVDGKTAGGMDGVYYNYCNGCGWTRAITFKQPKERL
jgi:Pyruvate/2-oxoacid:ferredoxin oxidoreductase delta subunit